MEHDERKLPTIRKIELRIWKIAKSADSTDPQLEACCLLIARIEAGEAETNQGQDEQLDLPTIREIELQVWRISRTNTSPTQLDACRLLIERIKARAEMNQGRGDDELPPDPIYQ